MSLVQGGVATFADFADSTPMLAHLALATFAVTSWPAHSAEVHYAPRENLERIDVQTLGEAQRTIDLTAYVLTD